jgi:toxin ParE1/3/4
VKPIIFHPDARAELCAAVAYYEQQRPGLGRDLQREVERTINRIQQHPQSFLQHDEAGLRKCFVRRFPYTIFYLELADQIWIAAVAHQRRRPGYWRNRIRREVGAARLTKHCT